MKKRLFLPVIIFAVTCTKASAQEDIIIYRDGRVTTTKIIQVNTDRTLVRPDKKSPEEWVDNTDVYMLKFKERGYVAFDENGNRIITTSGVKKVPKGAILIYLKNGNELSGYELRINGDKVTYKLTNKKGSPTRQIDKNEVFMLLYPDGSRDVLCDITAKTIPAADTTPAEANEENEDNTDETSKQETQSLRPAVITTKRGTKISVFVSKETKTTIAYKRVNDSKAPVFTVAKAKIKNIRYK